MRVRFPGRLRAWLRPDRVEREIDEELRFHLDRQTDDFIREGMTPAAARTAALRAFGGLEPSREACRDARGLRLLNELRQDVRYAARMLRKNATLSAVVTLTLAISIAATRRSSASLTPCC